MIETARPMNTNNTSDRPAIVYKETEKGCLRLTYQKAVFARMAELADAPGSNPVAARYVGSSPTLSTIFYNMETVLYENTL